MRGIKKRGVWLGLWLLLMLSAATGAAAAQDISLNVAQVNLLPGMQLRLKASAGKRVTYRSSNRAVVTVGKTSGVITALGSGKCYITCKAKGMTKKKLLVTVYGSAKKAVRKQKMAIYGHRGYQDAYPENSLKAIRNTLKCGWAGAECDVYYTHSGEFLIMHDRSLQRTCGVRGSILDVTAENREAYPLLGGKGKEGTLIPTLEEVLKTMSANNGRLILHIKNISAVYADEFLEQIRSYGMEQRVIIYGEDKEALSYLASQGLETGFLTYAQNNAAVKRVADECQAAGIGWIVFYRTSKLAKTRIDYVHSLGLRAGSVMTNTKAQLLWAMDLNMDMVMVNHRFW